MKNKILPILNLSKMSSNTTDSFLELVQKQLKEAIDVIYKLFIDSLEKEIEELKKPQLLQIVREMTHHDENEEIELNERYYMTMIMGMSENLIKYANMSNDELKIGFIKYFAKNIKTSHHRITMNNFVHKDFRYLLQF